MVDSVQNSFVFLAFTVVWYLMHRSTKSRNQCVFGRLSVAGDSVTRDNVEVRHCVVGLECVLGESLCRRAGRVQTEQHTRRDDGDVV
jgi:hypothetical protein